LTVSAKIGIQVDGLKGACKWAFPGTVESTQESGRIADARRAIVLRDLTTAPGKEFERVMERIQRRLRNTNFKWNQAAHRDQGSMKEKRRFLRRLASQHKFSLSFVW